MKIVAISDTHQLHRDVIVPEGDVLIHCGDFTNQGTQGALADFLDWFISHPHQHKVFISGNHELGLDVGPTRPKKLKIINEFIEEHPALVYLENSSVMIEGLKFYGSPMTPRFMDWAWNINRGKDIAAYWKLIPDDTNVLITHGPPHGTLDLVDNLYGGRDPHQGCEELAVKVKTLSELKLHVFGHLHKQGGEHTLVGKTVFGNAATCNDAYKPVNPAIVVEL
jgi:predicted MPP superfamily phosphohydrolase